MSVCRSFGSNFLSSGPTRKVSIGILDSQQKTKYAAAKQDRATKPNTENGAYDSKVNTVVNTWGSRVAGATAKTNQVPEPESSPWISPKQAHSEVPKKFHCVKEAQGTHSVKFFSSQDSDLEYGHDKENKVNMVSKKRKAGEDGNTERVEKCSYARVQEGLESGRGAFEDKTNDQILRSREALRLKLCEILGPVSSPNQQSSNSQNVEKGETNMNPENSSVQKTNTVVNPQSSNSQSLSKGAANLKPEHNSVQMHNTVVNTQSINSQNVRKGATTLKPERIFVQKHNVVNPRQMSDPIETDSEVPNHNNKRPVTRSLSRNRAQTKVQPNKIKSGLSFNHNQKVQKSITFSAEGGSSRPHCAANSGPLSCRAKKSENKRSDIKPLEIFFPEKGSAINIQPSIERGKAHAPAEKTSSRKHRKDYLSCPPVDKMRKVELKNHCEGKYSHQSEVAKKADQFGDLNSTEFLERVDQHEGSGKLESKSTEQKDSISSPTFEFRVPNNEYSSNSKKTVMKEKGVSSPVSAEKRFTVEDFGFFKTVQTTTPDSYRSNLEAESTVSLIPLDVPDDAKGIKDSPTPNSISSSEERGVGDGLFKSLSEGKDYESSDDGVHMNEGYNGTVATDEFVPSEQIQEDTEDSNGSGRAVALFSIALERVKSKMKSFAAKKSSEIMMSVTEAAHLQLENLSSQIQSDVAKLTSHSKSERKRLEARLQEKQEAMMHINENFKEEVNQNLQDCRSILEAMEAHQMKVKGSIKRQKASHKKLLLEVEEANKMQIDDAQRRIETVQKLAKGKMLQLQHGISECLKEGFFG